MLVLNPYPQTPFPVVKGCVCLVGSASCRAFGHTRPASVPGLSVGLPPSPRLGLRSKPHFQKYIGFSTVCNADGKSRRHFYMSEYARRRYLLTGDIQLDKALKHGTFGINIVLAVFGKYFYSGEAHSYFVVALGILYKDGML